MKRIKGLIVKVTYRVSLGDVEVSDEVYEALGECYDKGGDVPEEYICTTDEESIASEWLNGNIEEADAMDWEYEIEDFEE